MKVCNMGKSPNVSGDITGHRVELSDSEWRPVVTTFDCTVSSTSHWRS